MKTNEKPCPNQIVNLLFDLGSSESDRIRQNPKGNQWKPRKIQCKPMGTKENQRKSDRNDKPKESKWKCKEQNQGVLNCFGGEFLGAFWGAFWRPFWGPFLRPFWVRFGVPFYTCLPHDITYPGLTQICFNCLGGRTLLTRGRDYIYIYIYM